MKTNKLILFALVILNCSLLLAQAQYEYEPSATYPFGLPNPDAPAQIKDYQPMIGVCDCISTKRNKDGKWSDPVNISWEFKYIMNGMAVQDQTLKTDGTHAGSIRQFNTANNQWYVHNYSFASPSSIIGTWQGGKEGDEIILYKDHKAPNGMDGKYKITFKNISDDGFNWAGEWVNLDESFKRLTWTVECVKRK